MAVRLAVPEHRYLLWERGRHLPDLRALPRVLAALGDAPAEPADLSLGARLKAWRFGHGLSLVEAAAMAGHRRERGDCGFERPGAARSLLTHWAGGVAG